MKKYVVKFDGREEAFSAEKVYQSAKRVGASDLLAKRVVKDVEKKVYSGIKTSEIYSKVKGLLKEDDYRIALRFNLKKGIRKLGPTGFPFEKYIGEILLNQGFEVKLNQEIPGACCIYEIDFLAEKDGLIYIGECKYRNLADGKVHSKDALANYARFLDIKNGNYFKKELRSLLVTNNKFTSRSLKYSKCVGVDLLGWRYPKNKGLEYLIESQKLYPITILPGLNKYLAELFAKEKIMLAKDLLEKDIKQSLGIRKIVRNPDVLIKQAKILLGKTNKEL